DLHHGRDEHHLCAPGASGDWHVTLRRRAAAFGRPCRQRRGQGLRCGGQSHRAWQRDLPHHARSARAIGEKEMPRVSKKQAQQNHAEVIAAASKLFRAKGINGVSVPALMAEAGLTHGAFYGHFGSKEELAAAACTHAIEQSDAIYDGLLERHSGDQSAALTEFVKRYTSRLHRDQPGLGCPIAALADDASREEFKG